MCSLSDPGGNFINTDTVYDDVYVLSVPSFTWKKLLTGQGPRWGHTCHYIGERKTTIVGDAEVSNVTLHNQNQLEVIALDDSDNFLGESKYSR